MIRLVDGATDTEAAARIRKTVWRWISVDAQTIEHFRATLPMFRDWVALLDGEPVGIGACGLLPTGEESTAAFALNSVLREARGQGVGTAIYRQVSEHARSLGKAELETWGFEDDPGGVAFAEHYGFVVVGRSRSLRLVLEDCPRPAIELPEGVAITTLAERPELSRGIWDLLDEAMADIPYGGDVPMRPPSYEVFTTRDLAGPKYIPEATFVAFQDDEVIGYARLAWMDRADGIGDHAMLAVRRSWRGQGIASALKAAQIAWALDNGLRELRTGNEDRNTSARAVNAKFPYVPLPDQLLYRGPLAEPKPGCGPLKCAQDRPREVSTIARLSRAVTCALSHVAGAQPAADRRYHLSASANGAEGTRTHPSDSSRDVPESRESEPRPH